MKQANLILLFFVLAYSVYAQQESKPTLVKPLAYDKYYLLSGPPKPLQIFIVEVQNDNYDLLKIIYFPKTDGLRGGETEFIVPRTLNNKTLWNLKLRYPGEKEKSYCKTDNFVRTESNNIAVNKEKEAVLRFRSTQMDADIKFNNLSEMPCMILESFSE